MPKSLSELAHDSIRPPLIGAIINSTMTGVVLLQMFIYFTRYRRDSTWLKSLVAFSVTISFLSVVLAFTVVYTRSVVLFGNAKMAKSCMTTMTIFLLMPPIQSATVQLFFSWRASRFIGSRAFFVGVIISAVIQVGCSVGSIIVGIFWPGWQRGWKINPTCVIWNSLASATDIAISGILVYHLRRRRTGHAESDELLSRVARFAFQSGILTAGWAVASLIFFAASRDSISVILIMAQPALYANNLLAALNCRLKTQNPPNDRESAQASIPDSPENPEKSQIPVSEVTFMSHGLRSKPISQTERETIDMESSLEITAASCVDIRRPLENN